MAGRDSQDLALPATQPSTSKARAGQDVALPAALPTSAKARESQDVALPAALPSTALVHDSQDVVLAAVSNNTLRKLRPIHAITAWRKQPFVKPHLGFLQNAALLAASPVHPPGGFMPPMITVHRAHVSAQQKRPYLGHLPGRRRPMPLAWVIN